MRVQLDPSINLDAIAALNTGTATANLQKRVAVALQTFGAYISDRTGGTGQGMGLFSPGQDLTDTRVTNPTSALMWGYPGNPLRAAGVTAGNPVGVLNGVVPYDYFEFPAIPWRTGTTPNVRVLSAWDGADGSTPVTIAPIGP